MKKKVEIILQHGWAFDSGCWRAWMPHLKENPDCELRVQTPDRGYFGNYRPVEAFSKERDVVKIIVAHSLGLHLLPEDILRSADLLVLAGAFSQFHSGDALEQKRSRRTVQLMAEKLQAVPVSVLDDFCSKVYHPLLTSQMLLMRKIENINVDLLADDLRLLNTNEFNLDLIRNIPQILLLHGSEDAIVSPSHAHLLNDELAQSSMVLFEGAGHSLPLTHVAPAWISIRTAMRQLLSVRT